MTARRAKADDRPAVAVIGGGFSGTMATIQLVRALPEAQPVAMYERGTSFGTGLAYSTALADHLLNVRAANMSAFPSEPDHFESWLAAAAPRVDGEVHETSSGLFVSRRLYGKYLQATLREAVGLHAPGGRLRLIGDEVLDIIPGADGYDLVTASGRTRRASAVVLATGHASPVPANDVRHVLNPWAPDAMSGLDARSPVLILGSALTMVDIVITLRTRGFQGPIIALSRRGLLPQRHQPAASWSKIDVSASDKSSVLRMMRRVRREVAIASAAQVDWRAVIDALRPLTREIWGAWSDVERRRFLRHARRFWDIHRHRMAPPNARMIDRELREGTLDIVAGRDPVFQFEKRAVLVTYRDRVSGGSVTLAVQRVFSATGLESASTSTDPLSRRLIERGLARLDPLGIGVDVNDAFGVLDHRGVRTGRLWAIGPIVRGTFWECTAVPDIRQHAAAVAGHVADALKTDHQTSSEPL